jgi:hypothetical protein
MADVYLLFFYTEGPEIDGGYDLSGIANSIKDRLSPFFRDVFSFSKRTLKEIPGSEDFCNSFDEELDQNPNSNKIGYFDFKAFLINHILGQIPEGSILVYHDSNFERNPQYWETDWVNINSICERLLQENQSDVFVQIERPGLLVKNHVKTYTIDQLFTDPRENYLVKNSNLLNAARIILRNSEYSRNLMREYERLCLDKSLIQKSPNPNPDPEFAWSCGDQDVLNCLIYREIFKRNLRPNFPLYSFMYRVIRFDKKPFNFPGQSWNPHPSSDILINETIIKNSI